MGLLDIFAFICGGYEKRSLQKKHISLSMLIKTLHYVQTLTEVSASKVQVFLMKFIPEETQNSNIVAAILNSTQQPGHVSVTLIHLQDFVRIASKEPFNYHSGLWLLLSHIILSQTCSKLQNDSIEDSEVDNRSGKRKILLTL